MSKGRMFALSAIGVVLFGCLGSAALFVVASRAVGAVNDLNVACSGVAVPDAAAYTPGAPQRVVGFEHLASGMWSYAGTLVPHSFTDATTVEEATLVLCFEPVETATLETCPYEGGATVQRTGQSQRVRVVAPKTGQVVRELAVAGQAPDACPTSVATGGGGGGVGVAVLGVTVATVGAQEAAPAAQVLAGPAPAALQVEAAFGDLLR